MKTRICSQCGKKFELRRKKSVCIECQPLLVFARKASSDEMTCPYCGNTKHKSEFYKVGAMCKSCRLLYFKRLRERLKKEAVMYKGGKCIRCGYNRIIYALDFHHRDPSKKSFSIAQVKGRKLENIVSELDKCDLLCKNCHTEIEAAMSI